MKMEERFTRQDNEDIVIIGELFDHTMRSDFGQLFRLMVNNLKTMEIGDSRNGSVSADRVLGRLEAYETIMADIQGFISRKDELQKPIEYAPEETELAHEQISPIRGGEI